jgi:integrase
MAHIEDRWHRTDRATGKKVRTSRYGNGKRWCVRYRKPAGGEARKAFHRQVDAERFKASLEADALRGIWIDQQIARSLCKDMAERWFETTAPLKATTRKDYRSLLDTHVLPAFGSQRLADIDTLSIRGWVARLQQAGLSASRTKHAYHVLAAVLEAGVQAGGLTRNPASGVRIPRGRRPAMHVLDAGQVEQLADAIESPYGTLVRFAAYTGLRAGEIVALRLKRLDLLRGAVHVVESTSDVKGHLITGATKTYADRTVRLPRFLRDELAAHLAGQDGPSHPDGYVFTGRHGGQLRHNYFVYTHFKPALTKVGLPTTVRFHDLRHTCASLLIAQGAHPRAVMEHLGHSSISVTMDRYGHLFPEELHRLADRLDAARGEAVEAQTRPQRTGGIDPGGKTAGERR